MLGAVVNHFGSGGPGQGRILYAVYLYICISIYTHRCIHIHTHMYQIVPGTRRGGSFENRKWLWEFNGLYIGAFLRWKSREPLKLWGASANEDMVVEKTWNERICAQLSEWTNEPANQQINESMKQWLNESTNQWTNESVNQWNSEPVNQRIDESVNQVRHAWSSK